MASPSAGQRQCKLNQRENKDQVMGGIGEGFSRDIAFQFGVLFLAAIGLVAIVLWLLRS